MIFYNLEYLLDANPPYDPTGVEDYYRECNRLIS